MWGVCLAGLVNVCGVSFMRDSFVVLFLFKNVYWRVFTHSLEQDRNMYGSRKSIQLGWIKIKRIYTQWPIPMCVEERKA